MKSMLRLTAPLRLRLWVAAVALSVLSACSALPGVSGASGASAGAGQAGCVALAAGLQYCLRPPSEAAAFEVQQQVVLHTPSRQDVALAQVENTDTRFVVALLSPLGPKLMQAQWSPPQLVQEQPDGLPVSAAMLAALVQMSLWPQQSVEAGLHGPYEWKDSPGEKGGQGQRQLWLRGQLWLDVRYSGELPTPADMHIRLPAHDLELQIQTLL